MNESLKTILRLVKENKLDFDEAIQIINELKFSQQYNSYPQWHTINTPTIGTTFNTTTGSSLGNGNYSFATGKIQ